MNHIRNIALTVFATLLLLALWVTPAQAITYQGGTTEQRSVVQAVLESCWLDYQWVEDTLGYIGVTFNPNLSGQGWASRGSITLRSTLTNEHLRHTAAHEWAHEIYVALGVERQWEWTLLCTGGVWDGTDWRTNPAECFAECMRYALWPDQVVPDTLLRAVAPEVCRSFLLRAALDIGGRPFRTEF